MNNAGPVLAGALCVLVVAVPVLLLIGATILRAAVSLVNKVLGGRSPTDLDYYDAVGDYRQARYPRNESHAGFLIPQPSVGRAMAIVLCVGVVNFVVNVGLAVAVGVSAPTGAPDMNAHGMVSLISLGVGLVVHTAMLSSMLPTSLGRAFAVVVAQFLIAILIAAGLGFAAVLLVSGLARG